MFSLLGTHLKLLERYYIPYYYFYGTNRFTDVKGGAAFAVGKGIPHIQADLPSLVSVHATGICIPIGNSKVLLLALYIPPGHLWCNMDFIELMRFINKFFLSDYLNNKNYI